jgi:hypothetical protein
LRSTGFEEANLYVLEKRVIGSVLSAGPIGPHHGQDVGDSRLRILAVEAKQSGDLAVHAR